MFRKLSIGTRLTAGVLGLLGVMAWHAPAHAVIVTPGTPAAGEQSLYSIMNSLYGAGNWVQEDNAMYQNQSNPGTPYQVNFQIRYASDSATFGYINGGTYTSLMSMNATSASPGSVTIPAMAQTWNFGFRNTVTGTLFSSNQLQNPDGRDHLIEFQILNQADTYVLAWEDMVNGDYDYQDAVLQTTWTAGDPDPVPEPASILLLGVGCLGAGLVARRRAGKPAC